MLPQAVFETETSRYFYGLYFYRASPVYTNLQTIIQLTYLDLKMYIEAVKLLTSFEFSFSL